jgi:hypothetical protein
VEERKVRIGLKTYTEVGGLKCAECGNELVLKEDKYGVRYLPASCDREYCVGSVGAHPDGRPLGKPADRRTKLARINAHEEFDRLWKNGGRMARAQAYAWMIRALGIEAKDAHIGEFDAARCRKLAEAMRRDFPDLFPFSLDDF